MSDQVEEFVGPASLEEARNEAGRRLADVIRIAAGLAANPDWARRAELNRAGAGSQATLSMILADDALDIVVACENVCGVI
jgi:2,4-dienoyl-CoA reductase-like NADH-dependent reductase (Old Yellow Enzyme family)